MGGGRLSDDGRRLALGSFRNHDGYDPSINNWYKSGSIRIFEQEAVTGWVTSVEFQTSDDDNSPWTPVDGGNNFATGNVDYDTKSFIEFDNSPLQTARYLRVIPKTGPVGKPMVLRVAALVKSDITKFGDGAIYTINYDSPPNPTEASINAYAVKRKDTIVDLYDSGQVGAAYIDDQASIDLNAERFLRTVLTTFKYVIPTFQPRDPIAKHDYQQNLKFKDWNDISSYLYLTIKDVINTPSIFTNLGARMIKRNPLATEGGDIFTLEKHVVGSDVNNNILIDDVAEWWNDPENPNDVSAPVRAITLIATTIFEGDIVYQDVLNRDFDNVTIEGLIVDKPNDTTLMISWKSAVNTTASPDLILPSMPEYDILFRDGEIYTLDSETTAQITIA